MKLFKNIACCLSLLAIGLMASCSRDTDPAPVPLDELEGLELITSVKNKSHTVDLYSVSGKLTTGYNELFFLIRNANESAVANNITAKWTPLMKTDGSEHSCVASQVAALKGTSSLFSGFIIFPMAGDWELPISYQIGGANYTATGKTAVQAAPARVVESFSGTDGQEYILTMLDPLKPVKGSNSMSALLYRMKPASGFEPVDGYTIKIDPRMPAMSNNHGSPNNVDLTFKDGVYEGTVNLTMTGYWKINLQIANEKGEVIKGEPVTGSNPGSSIYFEIEL